MGTATSAWLRFQLCLYFTGSDATEDAVQGSPAASCHQLLISTCEHPRFPRSGLSLPWTADGYMDIGNDFHVLCLSSTAISSLKQPAEHCNLCCSKQGCRRTCPCVWCMLGGRIDAFKGDRKEKAGKMHMEPSPQDKSKYSILAEEWLAYHQLIP